MEKKSIGGEIVVGAQAMGVVRGGGKRGITPPRLWREGGKSRGVGRKNVGPGGGK